MNNNVRDLIDWWIIREKTLSKRNHDEFVRFFIYYMCLDAWITAESGEDNDSKKIKWLVDSNNLLKKKFYEAKRDELRALVGSKIEDMGPRHRGKYVELKDPDNFEESVKFIYQIRCNLFHGSKDPMNGRDSSLVYHAGNFLGDWIRWARL